MKKLLAVILSFAMLMSFAALPVHATGYATSEKEEILALACQAFPEYTDIICGRVSTYQTRQNANEKPEIVFSETRSISDNQSISITYYSDGGALLASSTIECEKTYEDVEQSGGTLYYWTVSGKFTTTYDDYPGVCTVSNVKCTIRTTGADTVTNTGSVSTDSYCVYNSNLSSTTKAKHSVSFKNYYLPSGYYLKTAVVGFEIANDTVVPIVDETT